MKKIEKSEIYGAGGAAVAGILLILILMLFGLSFQFPIREESSIRLGDSDDGGGRGGARDFFEPTPMSALQPTPVAPPPTPVVPSVNPLQTQNFEESIEAREAREREEERRREEQQQLQEQRARERAEHERMEAERRAEEARLAEERRIQAERDAQAAAIRDRTTGALSGGGGASSGIGADAGTSSGGGTGAGSGDGTGVGNQGNPFGTGTSGRGAEARVGSRNVLGGLPKPTDDVPVEGTIVVDIVVDPEGNVIKANIGRGTNITEHRVRNAALEAARRTKFSKGTQTEMGTITYRYRLN